MISVVMVNSREDKHKNWVQIARDSVARQTIEVQLVEINNVGRERTIGQCWNEGVKKAKYDLILFLGDDDWISQDYCSVLIQYALSNPEYVMWTTYMTAFHNDSKLYTVLTRVCTGMWRKEYLLEHPFNEKLFSGIDREYLEEMKKRGDVGFTINHHFGYYYRKHSDYSCAGDITLRDEDSPVDIYVLTSGRSFIDPLIKEWKKSKEVYVSTDEFEPLVADKAEIIFCEWLRNPAIEMIEYECKAKKILRLHAYEAFSELIYYTDFSKFDVVIFVAEHIKDFVESKVGKLPNAVVIPVGIGINGFNPRTKVKNNKIAYAGEITRKKGIGELLFIAKNLPEYDFYMAGKFNEEDVARHLNEKLPDNVFIEPYSYNLPKFFENKTYIINASLREGNPITIQEGMAYGLKPLISDWVGADKIYGGYVYKDLEDIKKLLEGSYEPEKYKKFVKDNFNFDDTYKQIKKLIEVKDEKVII